jgi:hypothetical protein
MRQVEVRVLSVIDVLVRTGVLSDSHSFGEHAPCCIPAAVLCAQALTRLMRQVQSVGASLSLWQSSLTRWCNGGGTER